ILGCSCSCRRRTSPSARRTSNKRRQRGPPYRCSRRKISGGRPCYSVRRPFLTGGSFPRAPHLRDEDYLRLLLTPPYFRGNPCIMPHEDAPHHGQAARQQRLGRPIHQV
ncbi:unnamed protein product, partial [Ectocarpus sp. 8 AP-2014]